MFLSQSLTKRLCDHYYTGYKMSEFTLYRYDVRLIRHTIMVDELGIEILTSDEITKEEALDRAKIKFENDSKNYDQYHRSIAEEEVEQEYYLHSVEAERQVFDTKTIYP